MKIAFQQLINLQNGNVHFGSVLNRQCLRWHGDAIWPPPRCLPNTLQNMASPILNFNIGVLGHVDSGKTSLTKSLSTTASTACYDKSPQSKERGITIDLGFSSFVVDIPSHLEGNSYKQLQITLVDCPGHASLIRTIIGGAQIIDLMLLVVDVTKGMQTQTAECLVIGEITCQHMIVVLNKIDLLPTDKKAAAIEKMTKKMKLTLQNTKFKDSPIVPVSAKPGGSDDNSQSGIGIIDLIACISQHVYMPKRDGKGAFVFAVDHCFSIRGQGTVMTGTILNGAVAINDNVEIPAIKETRKVKSMQMFHRPVQTAQQGDRLGLCVTQFDPKLLERGLVCTPGYIKTIYAAIVSLKKIQYYKGDIQTKTKFHISVGHETVTARITLFGDNSGSSEFNIDSDYFYLDHYPNDSDSENKENTTMLASCYVLLELDRPIPLPPNSVVIGSRLDGDIHANTCRLAFRGEIQTSSEDKQFAENFLPLLKIYKNKCKEGTVERIQNEKEIIGKAMFKRKSNIQAFEGLKVQLSTGESGVIEGIFGQTGKVKIRIPDGLSEQTLGIYGTKGKKGPSVKREPWKIILNFKRYIYDPQKRMIQT